MSLLTYFKQSHRLGIFTLFAVALSGCDAKFNTQKPYVETPNTSVSLLEGEGEADNREPLEPNRPQPLDSIQETQLDLNSESNPIENAHSNHVGGSTDDFLSTVDNTLDSTTTLPSPRTQIDLSHYIQPLTEQGQSPGLMVAVIDRNGVKGIGRQECASMAHLNQ